jgi:hypothetical protein
MRRRGPRRRQPVSAWLPPRVETIAITARATQTVMTPARPVKIAAIASSGIETAIDPSTISF